MNRQHHISLRDEFDEHDCDGTRYIVLLDDGYPVATCRFYEDGEGAVTLGRVVVLPEYRGKKLGNKVVKEAEEWIKELHLNFQTQLIENIASVTYSMQVLHRLGFRWDQTSREYVDMIFDMLSTMRYFEE